MILKPRPSLYIAMIVGGIVIVSIGFGSAYAVGGWFAIFPSVFGLLGLFWIYTSVRVLAKRNQMAISISPDGIELPCRPGSDRLLLKWADIATVAKHESMRGRGIEIVMKDGSKGFIQVRNYCEISDFLEHCKQNDIAQQSTAPLPTAPAGPSEGAR